MREITHINLAKRFRGGERQTLLLIEELSVRGYTQHIHIRLSNTLFASKLKEIKNLTIHPITKPYIFSIFTIPKPQHIIAHEAKGYQLAYFYNLFRNTPYILVRRVDFVIKNNFLNQLIYKKASKIVSLSHSISEKITTLNQKLQPIVIPDSYTEFTINPQNVSQLKEQFKEKYIIGNIAALDPKKGQREILEVAKYYQSIKPNIHFLLLGDGEDRAYLQQNSQELTNITFTGFVDNVGDYLEVFNLFLFPSHAEGFGSILLDAMRANVPIVASNVGGIPDIIKDNQNGLLLDDLKTDTIINAIEKIKSNSPLQEKLCKNALASIENYSIQNITSAYEDIILNII